MTKQKTIGYIGESIVRRKLKSLGFKVQRENYKVDLFVEGLPVEVKTLGICKQNVITIRRNKIYGEKAFSTLVVLKLPKTFYIIPSEYVPNKDGFEISSYYDKFINKFELLVNIPVYN